MDLIPFIVTPRKDTGLFNSKIAIWLFLASEVMLFGGLFSAYLFLRIYADYPWPERTLPILPGFINTFILIASSVAVVFAWAALKMRQWRKFQAWMAFTLICAVAFMGLKAIEYKAKFGHQGVRMTDEVVLAGHLHSVKGEHGGEAAAKDQPKWHYKAVHFEATKVDFSVTRFHKELAGDVIAQAKKQNVKLLEANSGEELTVDLLKKAQKSFTDAKVNNAKLRTAALRKAWEDARAENPGKNSRELAPLVKVDEEALKGHLVRAPATLTFKLSQPTVFSFNPQKVLESGDVASLKDDTVLHGKLMKSDMQLHVDSIDFRYLVEKAKDKSIDPDAAIEKSWVIQNNPIIKGIWDKHKQYVSELTAKLAAKGKEPTEADRYKVSWQKILKYTEGKDIGTFSLAGFAGADHKKFDFPGLSIPLEKVAFESSFTPRWNTYYATYFTITGLHGLHVIGGAIVLGYYLFFGKKMYRENPEWLANRVEVGGLFWHFVDLVWIFLFPILYLM